MNLPTIRLSKSCYYDVDVFELGEFIAKVYGVQHPRHMWKWYLGKRPPRVELVQMEEWNNDEQHSFTLKKEKIGTYDREELDAFMRNPHDVTFTLGTILTDMCNNGYLPEGRLLINVYW